MLAYMVAYAVNQPQDLDKVVPAEEKKELVPAQKQRQEGWVHDKWWEDTP